MGVSGRMSWLGTAAIALPIWVGTSAVLAARFLRK
jgi:hypothetical protein